jgi:L-threonylcarbamoyladenylate synthase
VKDEQLISILKNDGIIVMLTDTLYGILGSAASKKAVARIFEVKGRSSKKPLIVFISDISQIAGFGVKKVPEDLKSIWPDQITVVLPASANKFKYIHRGINTIAFRMPKNKRLIELIREVGPLVAPSANPQGKEPAKNITEAKKYFGKDIDMYVPGVLKKSQPSTILKYLNGKWKLVREGAVKASSKKLKSLLQ